MYAPPLELVLEYLKNRPNCAKPGYKSIFQFEKTEDGDGLEIYFGRITPEEPEVELQKIATLRGGKEAHISFMKVAQGSLDMMDDNTWTEPDKWSIE